MKANKIINANQNYKHETQKLQTPTSTTSTRLFILLNQILVPDRKYTNQYGVDDRKKNKQEEKGQNRHERDLIWIT